MITATRYVKRMAFYSLDRRSRSDEIADIVRVLTNPKLVNALRSRGIRWRAASNKRCLSLLRHFIHMVESSGCIGRVAFGWDGVLVLL